MNDSLEKQYLVNNINWRSFIRQKATKKITIGCFQQSPNAGETLVKHTVSYEGNNKYELLEPKTTWRRITREDACELFKQCAQNVTTHISWVLKKDTGAKGLRIEVREFMQIHYSDSRLFIASIKPDSPGTADLSNLPNWLGEEITGDTRWSEVSLCLIGEPS